MIDLGTHITLDDLRDPIERMWAVSADKLLDTERTYDFGQGAPVHTVRGRYRARGWTEWTLGFHVGSALLQFEASRDEQFLELGRTATLLRLQPHITHFGVHDHGFTIVSTFGTLLRLMDEGRIAQNDWERTSYCIALLSSGAIQARRWTDLGGGHGYIYSFNGPHSLFADTIRSLRSLALAYLLGGALSGEQDERISLLDRLLTHARTTAEYIVYYGQGRDGYDVCGRVAHEAVFNVVSKQFRCASTQQGYAPFTTWTRGLAWIICGYAELVEFVDRLPDDALAGGKAAVLGELMRPLRAASNYYVANTPTCGVPYWDTGAPNLHRLGDWQGRAADPFNEWEPVDSSAAAIAAQGLLRLGHFLGKKGAKYEQAGLRVAKTILQDPYLNTNTTHQGLLLHSVYHWPQRWDYVPEGRRVACGESAMWGDYHLRELALYLQRLQRGEPYLRFCNVRANS